VASLTEAVLKWNAEHAEEIARGEVAERPLPDEEFIVKASGIDRAYVMEKSGVLDPARMRPRLETRSEDELGIQAEMSMPAIHEALAQAGRSPIRCRRRDRRVLEPAARLPGRGDRDPGRARRRPGGATT
jgi:beta-ketodecanoyl-[acyl-carrier-protein] synthase